VDFTNSSLKSYGEQPSIVVLAVRDQCKEHFRRLRRYASRRLKSGRPARNLSRFVNSPSWLCLHLNVTVSNVLKCGSGYSLKIPPLLVTPVLTNTRRFETLSTHVIRFKEQTVINKFSCHLSRSWRSYKRMS
jgi:hypothetical protein